MVLSDQYKFAFVHIPKCAGSSVRKLCEGICDPALSQKFYQHEQLGKLHFTHLPLWVLRDYFPEIFERFTACESFAVVREPMDRFCSSVLQRCREFLNLPSGDIEPKALIQAAEEAMNHFEQDPRSIDYRFVHFIPQSEYILLDGRQLVDHIDPMGSFENLNRFFEARGLPTLDAALQVNVSMQPANRMFKACIGAVRPLVLAVLPGTLRGLIWRKLIACGVYKPLEDDIYAPLKNNERIAAFVRQFYARDFEIYRRVMAESRVKKG